ncbi:hypothetical protein OCGS_1795 [Oceaniovalibus guishaninsula JLT2003]|uniref:Porin domain-containing protein n=1 Tax=Oceaniovalibus guishaninsula JLT2003 TaxID=1231392 RepID=K2HN53_9RHOB|nr:porin [Oceaniovalibus guishaninsula]EKE44279.1 hypothetical protein OCGS_1795 [Oceaniovalibus guishaninsula JLT2003]
MNKFLLATTALVASTTFAMADVDLSGTAEMGIFGGTDIDAQFHTDIDVTFSMSGETDAGLTFGASVDLDEQIGDNNADDGLGESGATRNDADDGGATIFVSGTYGTLTMGDTDGALDFVMTEAIIGGSLGDNHEHLGYNGNSGFDGDYDGQVARYDYSFGDFAVAISAEIDDDNDEIDFDDDFDGVIDRTDEIDNDTILGIGVRYTGQFANVSFGAGLGYQRSGNTFPVDTDGDDKFDDTDDITGEVVGLSLDMKMDNGLQAILNYSTYNDSTLVIVEDNDDVDDGDIVAVVGDLDKHYGLAVGYEFGSFLVAANYGKFDTNNGDLSGWGLVVNYDLGGGAELQAGYGHNKVDEDFDDGRDDDFDFDTYSFGIAMSF